MTAIKVTWLPILITLAAALLTWFGVVPLPKWVWTVVGTFLTIIVLLFTIARNARKLEGTGLLASYNTSIEGCRQETKFSVRVGGGDVIYFRLYVENTGAKVLRNCTATLFGMEKDGVSLGYGETTPLIWTTTNGDITSLDIQGKNHAFSNVIRAFPSGSGGESKPESVRDALEQALENIGAEVVTGIATLKSVTNKHKISENGKYTLKVKLSSDEGAAKMYDVIFNWTGDWKTAEMSCHAVNT